MKSQLSLLILVGLSLVGFAWAGELEPPGPPAPTMVTLQELFEKLDDCAGGGPCVPKTGQTGCWNQFGGSTECSGSGHDGESQAGATIAPRLTDNGDGSVTDHLTGLVWLKNADCFGGERAWSEALYDANTLATGTCGLTDGSTAGDWRLPNVKELQSVIDFGQSNPALPAGYPFTGTASYYYWTSTSHIGSQTHAWRLYLRTGSVGHSDKLNPNVGQVHVWPVR